MSAPKWVIYDSISKVQSQPIDKEILQLTIYKMKPHDFKRFFIWTEGWENWQGLEQFLNGDQKEFFKDIKSSQKEAEKKAAKPSKKEKTVTKSVTRIMINGDFTKTSAKGTGKDFSGDSLSLTATTPPVKLDFKSLAEKNAYARRATRHELKIEILLISPKGKTFKSFSKNISLTGTLLEDNIPFDFYETTFDVLVINRYSDNLQNSRVQLKAKTAGEGITSRIQFEAVPVKTSEKLKLLLEEYIKNQKKADKKSA